MLYIIISVLVCAPLIVLVERAIRRQKAHQHSVYMLRAIAAYEETDRRLNYRTWQEVPND
jgi:hypothetical protein